MHTDFDAENEAGWWSKKIYEHVTAIRSNLESIVPWLLLPATPEKFGPLIPALPGIPTLAQLSKIEQSLLNKINGCYKEDNTTAENEWLDNYLAYITASGRKAKEIILLSEQLAFKCHQLATIDYDFLYDKSQHLLTIGYNAEETS